MRIRITTISGILGASAMLIGLGGTCLAADSAKPAAAVAAPKFVQFDPATYKGETGKITLAYEGQGYVILSELVDGKPADYLTPACKDGVYTAPVGRYRVVGSAVTILNKSGVQWSIMPAASGDIEVKAGGTTKLGVGSLLESLKSGKTGTIVAPAGYGDLNVSLQAIDNGKPGDRLTAYSMGKPLTVPCGTYAFVGCYAGVTDKAGTRWMINITGAPGKSAKPIEVKADSETMMAINDLLVASVDMNQTGEKLTASLKLTNANGQTCTIKPLDPKAEPPSFQVLDKSGKVVMSGKFQYGWGGSCSYSGGIPSEVKGTVTIKPVLDAGPFKVNTKDTVWTRK